MHFVDATAGELLEQRRQIDLSVGARQQHHLRPALFENGDPARSCRGGSDQDVATQQPGLRREFQPAIDHHFQRLPQIPGEPIIHTAHVELRIVAANGADPGQNGAGARAPAMSVLPGRRPGQPLAGAIAQRCLAVEAGGQFHAQPRPRTRHPCDKADVEFSGLDLEQPTLGQHTSVAQDRQPLPGHQRIGILHGDDNPPHTSRQQRLGTRWRATMVAAGLERDVSGGRTCFLSGKVQGEHFGMLLPRTAMPAFADDPAILDDDAADTGVGSGGVESEFGKAQRPRHHFVVSGTEPRRHQRPSFCGERETSRMSLENSSTSSKLR